MKLLSTLFGQCIRLSTPEGAFNQNTHHANLFRDLLSHYGFLEGPSKLEDFDGDKGVTFRRGVFKGATIERFVMFTNGILAEGALETDTVQEFLGDVVKWWHAQSGILMVHPAPPYEAFASNLEVHSEIDLTSAFKPLEAIGRLVTDKLKGYGWTYKNYEVSKIALQSEAPPGSAEQPEIEFARRVGRPFSDQVYFSSAPLRTVDHLEYLNQLEAVFREISPSA